MAKRNSSESGNAILEFAIIVPFVVVLIFAVTDFCLFLQNYFEANHLMRESLRYASGVANLERGVHSPGPTMTTNHQLIHNRAVILAATTGMSLKNSSNRTLGLNITSECRKIGLTNTYDRVIVNVNAGYNSIFSSLASQIFGNVSATGIPFTVSGDAPYLYNDCK